MKMLAELLERADLPEERIFFLHVKLRNLQRLSGLSYAQLSEAVIEQFRRYRPFAILVPSYSIYAFMHGGVFHRRFSRAETGRFGEEIRRQDTAWRSPDPMYSVLDPLGYLPGLNLDYTRTFGEHSLFEHLREMDDIIINLDLGGIWSTHFHQAEIAHQVPYRFHRRLSGVLYHDETRWETVEYQAYLRATGPDGGSHPAYHRENTRRYLLDQGALNLTTHQGVELVWTSASVFLDAVNQALDRDPEFLIIKDN